MTTTLSATVVNGALQLDEPLTLPEQSRVQVTVIAEPQDEDEVTRRREVLRKFRAFSDARPIFSSGERLTRDQMHERH